MKKEVLKFIIESITKNIPCVLLLVVDSKGHSPGRAGFVMAVTQKKLCGTIGGGALEKNMVNHARKSIAEETLYPEVFQRIHQVSAGKKSSGMVCGGEQTVLFFPVELKHISVFRECLFDSEKITLIFTPKGLTYSHKLEIDVPAFSQKSETEWKYELVINERFTAYIFGAGHVSLALSPILASLGFRVVILDERARLNTIEQNRHCDELITGSWNTLPKEIEEGSNSYVFIMTPSHVYDETVLRGLLGKNIKYLGMMASKTKVAEIFGRLREEGVSEETLSTVHSPIGLAIKSRTPEEIAISIASEVILVKNS